LTNDEWESMFLAFKTLVKDHDLALNPDQQNKFERAWTTFQHDKNLHERCMDRKMTKMSAWAMINVIREVWNKSKGIDIPNEDRPVKPNSPHELKKYRREINITIQETLFEIE
jgi:hypothetical protein